MIAGIREITGWLSSNLTTLARIQTAVRRFARAHGLQRRSVRAPRGRRYSKSGRPFVEDEYGAVYTRPVRAGASRIPRDVAAAIHQHWSAGVVDEFATDQSYFHEIRARLELDLRNIRGAVLRWRTEEPQPDARPDEDDEPPEPEEWQSYYVFFLAPDGDEFHCNATGRMEEPEDAEREEAAIACPGEGWIGCAVGISLVAPYAVTNLCSYECDEDGTISLPDVESFIYSDKTQQRVDTDRFHREILSQAAFQTLETLRAQIVSILTKHRIHVLDRTVLSLRVPGLKASEDVFLEGPPRVQDAFFFRGI